MANKLILKRSSVAGKVPLATDLAVGELSVNLADKLLFTKDASGNVINVGGSSGGSGSAPVVDQFAGDGTTVNFTLSSAPASKYTLFVIVGGLVQPKSSFSVTGTTLTFTEAPPAPPGGVTYNVEVCGASVLTIGTPTDGTVTPAKLSSGAPSWDSGSNFFVARTTAVSAGSAYAYFQGGIVSTDSVNHARYSPERIQFYTASNFYVLNASSVGVVLSSGSTSWGAQSDERTKDIIEPITNAAAKLRTWRTVIGKYKTDEEGTRRSFFIAQDVQANFNEAVGSDNEGILSLRYSETIPMVAAAVNEHTDEIATLNARIAALEQQIAAK